MSKKNLLDQDNNPLDPLFNTQEALAKKEEEDQEEKPKKPGRPRKDNVVRGNSKQEGLTEDYTRATVIVKIDTLERAKDYAYTQRISIKEAISDLLDIGLKHEETRLSKKGIEIVKRGEGKQ